MQRRAGDQRVRPRAAGDLDPAHRRARRRGQPDEVPGHRARRRPPARAVRLVRPQAVPGPDRQRRPHPPQSVGRGRDAAACCTTRSSRVASRARGGHFIAGVAEHLPALVALTAPSYNSFRRLTPSAWASATTAWGFDNKEAALRVASPFYQREEQTYNIEFKASDGERQPLPGPRCADRLRPGRHRARSRAGGALPSTTRPGCRRTSWRAARSGPCRPGWAPPGRAGEGRRCSRTPSAPLLARCYLAVRRSEDAAFAAEDLDFEIRHHFYRF